MAEISVTPARVSIVHHAAEVYEFVAGEALEKGDPIAINAAGRAVKADANGATNKFRGIALNKVSPGGGVSILVRGMLYGYDLSGLAYDAAVYVSETAGKLTDTAGTANLLVGRVMPLSEPGAPKVLFVTGWSG